YLRSVAARRELPIVKKIAIGSIRNKLVFILPVALLLSQFLPWLLPIVLMAGGTYLAYEVAEKIWHRVSGHHDAGVPATGVSPEAEQKLVAGAIRTDLILSAEIMVIAPDEVATEPFWSRLAMLSVVAGLIRVLASGVVAAIVTVAVVGLRVAARDSGFSQRLGRGLVKATPRVLAVTSVVATVAMLWVGGHILLVNLGAAGTGWV